MPFQSPKLTFLNEWIGSHYVVKINLLVNILTYAI